MRSLNVLVAAVASFCVANVAAAKPTNGILFSCKKVTQAADGSETTNLTVGGIIPANGTNRLAIHYKTASGEYAVLNEAESNFRTAQGDDLRKRYGSNRTVTNDSDSKVTVDFDARTISVKVRLTVKVNGVDQSREVYLSSVPGSLLYSRNDENGKTASNFNAVFTGIDPAAPTAQMSDSLVTCSFNDNFN